MQGPFHDGEREVQRRAGVLEEADAVGPIIGATVSSGVARFLVRQRLVVATTLDPAGRVWTSLLAGAPGFVAAVDPTLVRIAAVPIPGDPLVTNLAARPELGLLVIDPQTRQRVRLNGRALLDAEGLFLSVRQAYGNCPKYIKRRTLEIGEARATADAPRVTPRLDDAQRAWIDGADTFFIGSVHPQGGADASHRGGSPGFVRTLGPERLRFPDYPGNAMFNTLGNLVSNPRAGLLFVDFTAGHVLQLTGRARVEDDFAVVFDVDEVRETRDASPLRSHEDGGGIRRT